MSDLFSVWQDVGHAILESYSRIIESLAFTVLSRIEDVLQADSLAQNPSNGEQKRYTLKDPSPITVKFPNPNDELEKTNSDETPTSMTLLDFMGWNLDQGETDAKKDVDSKVLPKPLNIMTNKKFSYIERLENLGGARSPTARH